MTVVLVAALVVMAVNVVHPGSVATHPVRVMPGDTMLSLAVQQMPDTDPARAAEIIEALNGLSSARLPVGSVLQVPVAREN